MKNAMQLKAIIKNMAASKNISAQIILQNYMMERFLERISLSSYKSNFILKGGFLIAAMVGLDTRATMDMDATLKALSVDIDTVRKMFEAICSITIDDDINFSIKHVEEIRESGGYSGLRVSLEAKYPPLNVPLKVDVTTGDKITPKEIIFKYNLLFETRSIKVLAYNIETILAEKLETVISRGDQNTRPRDYYDIYIIHKMQWQNVNTNTLRTAIMATANNRKSIMLFDRYTEILQTISNSDAMDKYWTGYQNQFDYAKDIEFKEICRVIKEILDLIIPLAYKL